MRFFGWRRPNFVRSTPGQSWSQGRNSTPQWYSATTRKDEDRLKPAIVLFEKDCKGKMRGEKPHVSRSVSIDLLTAVI